MSILLVGFLVVFFAFTPIYLVQVRGISAGKMSWIMSSFGLASIAIAFIVPGLSDRIGRKPVAIVAGLLGVIIPLGALWADGSSLWPYYICFAAGAAISGVFPLAMATIPSEVVPPGLTATALSLTMGTSEIVGGVLAPLVAGKLADAHGLQIRCGSSRALRSPWASWRCCCGRRRPWCWRAADERVRLCHRRRGHGRMRAGGATCQRIRRFASA